MEQHKNNNAITLTLWRHNPLVILCLCFALGILLSLWIPFDFGIILAISVVLLILGIVLHCLKRSIMITLLALFLLCGALHGQLGIPLWYRHDAIPPKEMNISGDITEITRIGDNSMTCIIGHGTDDEGETLDGGVELMMFGSDGAYLAYEYPVGSRVSLTTRLYLPSERQQYGGYSGRMAAMRQGVRYEAVAHHGMVHLEALDDAPKPTLVYRLRQGLRDQIDDKIGGQEGALLIALITADKSQLEDQNKLPFYDLGLAHVLATSGLHIGLLLLLIQRLCKRHRIGFIIQTVISLILVAVFIMIAGLRSSLSRAAIMWLVVVLPRLLGRQSNGLNALALSAMVILVINPITIMDAGFILSVSSVLALITLYDPLSQPVQKVLQNKWGKCFLTPFVASIAVYLFSWAIMAYYFNQVNILAPIWNAIFIPIMTILLGIGFIFMATCWIPVIGTIVGFYIRAVVQLIFKATQGLQSININLPCPSPAPWVIGLAVLGALLLSSKIITGKRRIRVPVACAMILASILGLMITTAPREEIVTYSSMGKSAIYVSNEGKQAIIFNEAVYGMESMIKKQGEHCLHALIYTGNDPDDVQMIKEQWEAYEGYTLYLHRDVYDQLKQSEKEGTTPLDEGAVQQIGDVAINLQTFKAKSKTAKSHYAAVITAWGRTIHYLDPLRLREGSFDDVDIMVASRWSKSRLDHVMAVMPSTLIMDDGSHLGYGALSALEDQGMTLYNINRDGAITLSPEGVQPYRKLIDEKQ